MSRTTIKNFIVATTLLLVALGAFGYTYKIISDKEKTLETQLEAIKIGNNREQTHYQLQKIAEESKIERDRLDKYFLPHIGESITFLTLVETLAPQNGINLKTDALEEGSDKKTKEKWVDVDFTFSGTRGDVERYISTLENLPYVSRITSADLSARASDNWEARVSIRVFITSYEK